MSAHPVAVLYTEWLNAKAQETQAAAQRREIEDKLFSAMELVEGDEGVTTIEAHGHKIKCTQRLTRSVDSDALQEIAAENGLSEHLSHLFRWKPSINMTHWKDASEEITEPLSVAITTKAGRPSFSIEPIEGE